MTLEARGSPAQFWIVKKSPAARAAFPSQQLAKAADFRAAAVAPAGAALGVAASAAATLRGVQGQHFCLDLLAAGLCDLARTVPGEVALLLREVRRCLQGKVEAFAVARRPSESHSREKLLADGEERPALFRVRTNLGLLALWRLPARHCWESTRFFGIHRLPRDLNLFYTALVKAQYVEKNDPRCSRPSLEGARAGLLTALHQRAPQRAAGHWQDREARLPNSVTRYFLGTARESLHTCKVPCRATAASAEDAASRP